MGLGQKSIDNIIIWFLIAFLAISGLIDVYFAWHITIVFLFLITAIIHKRKKICGKTVIVFLLASSFLFVVSAILSPNASALSYNVRSSLYSLCIIGILFIINSSDRNFLLKKLLENIKLLNALLIVNILTLALQTRRTGFLIKNSWLAINPYYEDHCAGLFGFNATNVLGLYSIFVMMLNLSYAHINKKENKRIIIYTLLTQAIMAFLSQYNDNTGFYMLLVIFLGVYALASIQRNRDLAKKIIRIFSYCMLIVILFIIALNLPVLGDHIRVSVLDKIQRVLFYDSFGGASGGSERLAIIRYALALKSTMLFGTGVGATQWIQANSYGFVHFGINSMGSYILIGGIWFYISYTLLFAEIYYSLFISSNREKQYTMKIIIIGIVIIFSLYTTIFNDARTALLIGLIAVVIKPMLKGKKKYNRGILRKGIKTYENR